VPSVPRKEAGLRPGTLQLRDGRTAGPAEGQVVNKSQLIDALAERYDGNRKAAAQALDSVLDTITRQVAKGEKVAITGFGSFEKTVRNARWVRNPQTGDRIKTKKKAVPKFTAGADLKNVTSGAKKLPALKKATAPAKKAAAPAKAAAKKATAPVKAAAKKATTAKKAPATKSAAKKASTAKKAPAKKASATKSAAKKAPAKKASTAKKAPAKKASTAKKTATKSAAKKAPAKKTSTAKKAPAKKSPAKKTAKKS
jgi:DNA-binding protein HU-beta